MQGRPSRVPTGAATFEEGTSCDKRESRREEDECAFVFAAAEDITGTFPYSLNKFCMPIQSRRGRLVLTIRLSIGSRFH